MEDVLITRAGTSLPIGGGIVVALALGLAGCGKIKQNDPVQAARVQAEAKREKAACGSSAAYERLKGLLFDAAIGRRRGDRANLDTLADYSTARMEEPVVKGRDAALDIIRCTGRFILEVPPGAERGLAGERRLQADIAYTAQAAADGNGFVYQLTGGEPIVARLAAFDLTGVAYRPPPAIDEQAGAAEPRPVETAAAEAPPPSPAAPPAAVPAPVVRRDSAPAARPPAVASVRGPEPLPRAPREPSAAASSAGTGEATVRAFYAGLGAADGRAASAQVVPEKRSSRAFSPDGIARFYGRLAEPLRVTAIAPLGPGAYRVRYRYSTGRAHCDGTAIVSLTSRGGRDLIRSIRALSGC